MAVRKKHHPHAPSDTPRSRRRNRLARLLDYPRSAHRGGRRWIPSWRLLLAVVILVPALGAGALAIAVSLTGIPRPNDFATREATSLTYSDGSTEIAHLGVNRRPVALADVPRSVRHAVLAAEDRSFYDEAGISPTGIARALKNNVSGGGGELQGGSTITQQYVKNYYLDQEQSLGRKVKEALVSLKIDNNLSKDTILQDYLNTIYLARGAYGVETASRMYFGKPVSALGDDPARAAYLAALIQSPYYYGTADTDPDARAALKDRWEYVLDGMVDEGWLSASRRADLRFPEPVAYHPDELGGMNGYMENAAVQYLEGLHKTHPEVPDATMLARGGYTVVTTFRKDTMRAARDAVRAGSASLRPKEKAADRGVHIGLAAVDNDSGAVTGFYGGPDYLRQGFNDALQAAGSPGPVVGQTLGKLTAGASPRFTKPTSWADQASTLDAMGIGGARPGHTARDGDDLTATPVRAAGVVATVGREYRAPYEVREVRKGKKVIWRAPDSPERVHDRAAPASRRTSRLTRGSDNSYQWAWSLGRDADTSVAVSMYATKDDGTTHRRLDDMSPLNKGRKYPEGVAVGRTSAIVDRFFLPAPGTRG